MLERGRPGLLAPIRPQPVRVRLIDRERHSKAPEDRGLAE